MCYNISGLTLKNVIGGEVMLNQKERIVTHPVLGKIKLNEKFSKVLDLPPFRELAFKSQLGVRWLSRLESGNHTRLMHSLGVYHLTGELLKSCEEKFSQYFTITEADKEAVQLAALGHDIGHRAFSHTLEDKSNETHEERTINLFKKYAEEINTIFGYDIVSLVISILEENIEIKNKGYEENNADELDIKFILKSLLVGAIDCDRMEYIMSDHLYIYGTWTDFRDIFDYITIVLLKDKPKLGFETKAIPAIEDFLIQRFDLYRYDYFDIENVTVDIALNCYSKLEASKGKNIEILTEQQILAELQERLRSGKDSEIREKRLAEIIVNASRNNLMIRRFENKEKFEDFVEKLGKYIPSKFILTTCRSNSVYTPSKHRIYVKDSEGMVKDIQNASLKIKELSVTYYYVWVDLEELDTTAKKIDQIREMFENNPIEIEKKFTWSQDVEEYFNITNYESILTNIIMRIKQENAVTTSTIEQVVNDDQYYDTFLRGDKTEKIAVRHRKSDDEECWYAKIPVYDGTSITKRYEYKFQCHNLEECKYQVAKLLNERREAINLRKGVGILTTRSRQVIELLDSKIEISCDFSTYRYEGKEASGLMVECELKQGDDLSLWYLAQIMKEMGFIETNESKEKRAKIALKIK